MEEQILIIGKDSSLPLVSLQAFYSCHQVSEEEVDGALANEFSVAIILARCESSALHQARTLRAVNPALPILFISDRREAELSLLRVEGYGPVRVLYAYSDDADQLLRDVQALMHPEYPAENRHIAIVLPVYNEEERFQNVRNFTAKLRDKLAVAYPNMTIFFVNDGSKDATQDLVEKVIADDSQEAQAIHSHSPVAAHKLEYNSRKAGTYIQGIKSIRADIIVFADADDSFEVEDIAAMINILHDGYWDMVIGTKDETAEGRSAMRSAMSFVKRMLTKPLLPAGVIDSQTGLKALSHTAACHILPYLHESTQLAIDLEMVHIARRLNFRVLQIPVKCIDREGSHIDIVRDSLRFLKSIVTIWASNRRVSSHALCQPKASKKQRANQVLTSKTAK